jgi:phage terminase small subunit
MNNQVLYAYTAFVILSSLYQLNTQAMRLQKLTRKQIREQLEFVPAETILSGNRNLTYKQKEFCRGLVKGLTKTEAYSQAYKHKGKRKTMSDNASRLSKDSRIQAEVEALERAKLYMDYQENAQKIAELRSLVVSQLTKEALDPESPPNARIQALSKLGSVSELQVFTERKIEKTIIQDSESAKANLMEKIKALMSDNMRTIDQQEPDDGEQLLALISGSKPQPITIPASQQPTAPPVDLVDVLASGNTHSNPDKRSQTKQGVGVQKSPHLANSPDTEDTPLTKSNT